MSEKKTTWARVQMLLIATVFLGPLLAAAILYYGGFFVAEGRSNHGALLEPITSIADQLPDSELITQGDGYWVLLYANDQDCASDCRQALYTLRQSRKMLGKDMDRLKRVFLRGESPVDTVFLAREHAGLITIRGESLSALLDNVRPQNLDAGGLYLVDPLGNLVMYFPPGTDPGDMVEDIKHLLKLSRIG